MQQTPQLNQQTSAGVLDAPLPRELTQQEITSIWQHSPLKGKQLLSMLLSGINIDEAATIARDNFDLEHNTIKLSGKHPRSLHLSPDLKSILAESDHAPVWQSSNLSGDDLRAFLSCTAADAGIEQFEQVNETALQHTYLCYLVRQGAKLSELENVCGYLSPSALNYFRTLSPAGPGLALNDVELAFPIT